MPRASFACRSYAAGQGRYQEVYRALGAPGAPQTQYSNFLKQLVFVKERTEARDDVPPVDRLIAALKSIKSFLSRRAAPHEDKLAEMKAAYGAALRMYRGLEDGDEDAYLDEYGNVVYLLRRVHDCAVDVACYAHVQSQALVAYANARAARESALRNRAARTIQREWRSARLHPDGAVFRRSIAAIAARWGMRP